MLVRHRAVAALVAVAVLAVPVLAGAATAGTATDPSGDAPSQVDIVSVTVDANAGGTGDVLFTLTLDGADGTADELVLLALRSPYAGALGGLISLGTFGTGAFDHTGEALDCTIATTGGGGSVRTYRVPAACLDLPDLVFVDALVLGEGIDVLEGRVLLDTPDDGPHAVTTVVDGDPATTERLDTADPVVAAVRTSRALFPTGGARTAVGAILAREDVFADALAGSGLHQVAGGPMLLTARDRLPDATATELARLLGGSGTVFVLGGPAAISDGVLDQLRAQGLTPRRLAGTDRIGTSIAIADAIDGVSEVLVVRAVGDLADPNGTAAWADSIAIAPYAAGTGDRAVVLVGPAGLDDGHRALLDRLAPSQVTILGGTAAVSSSVETELRSRGLAVRRVAGDNRFETAVAIEAELFSSGQALGSIPRPLTGPRGVVVLNAIHRDGWAFGLTAALVAATQGMPLVSITTTVVPDAVVPSLRGCDGVPAVEAWVLGDTSVLPAAVVADVDALDPTTC